jgi:adenylate cyclase class IV
LNQHTSKKFESEVRVFVNNISEFLKKLKTLNAKTVLTYHFNDHCFKPRKCSIEDWDPSRKTMRLRAWSHPETYSQILFSKTKILQWNDLQYKRTIYPQGKLELFRGEKGYAKELLEDWEFQEWFIVEKLKGELYNINSESTGEFAIALELEKKIGWMVEIECWGEDMNEVAQKIYERKDLLEIKTKDITFKSLPRIVAEKMQLI